VNQVQAQNYQSSQEIEAEKKDSEESGKTLHPICDNSDQKVSQINCDLNSQIFSNIKPVLVAELNKLLTTPILKHKSPNIQSSDRKNKRVSWVDQKADIGCSPTKLTEVKDIHNESEDVFGDTFQDMDFADMSLVEAKDRQDNLNNKSCPKTPNFDACSEELLLEESEQVKKLSCNFDYSNVYFSLLYIFYYLDSSFLSLMQR
jgi:hypothetical protein